MVVNNISLRSMAVLSSRAHERPSREKNKNKLLPPQSPRGFSALARLYYLARPTKTAMLRRLEQYEKSEHYNETPVNRKPNGRKNFIIQIAWNGTAMLTILPLRHQET